MSKDVYERLHVSTSFCHRIDPSKDEYGVSASSSGAKKDGTNTTGSTQRRILVYENVTLPQTSSPLYRSQSALPSLHLLTNRV